MASNVVVSWYSIFLLIFTCSSAISGAASNETMFPMACNSNIKKLCDASLYHVTSGLQAEREIAAAYTVNPSQMKPINRGGVQDYLITAPCACESAEGAFGTAYFHDTSFRVEPGNSLNDVSNQNYSGQAWISGDPVLLPGQEFGVKLLCGCVEDESKIVVTYTVQPDDTLSQIAKLLSADESEIQNLNGNLIRSPDFIKASWVLFVPMPKNERDAKGNSEEKYVLIDEW